MGLWRGYFLFTLHRPVKSQPVNVACGAVFTSWPCVTHAFDSLSVMI